MNVRGVRPPVPVLDAHQSAEWDARSRDAGIPSRVLMEAAGRAVAQVAGMRYGERMRRGVLIVAGHGNNGGDGWVAARALRANGFPVWATETDKERSPDCEANRSLALHAGVELVDPDGEWPHPALVVDALLGTGASGEPRGVIGDLAHRLMSLDAPIVAVDGPTGLDLSTGHAAGPVRAALTVTFGGARRGHLLAREWCGRVVVVDIGFVRADSDWPTLIDDPWTARHLPEFEVAMHKGQRGRVLIIGGEPGMAGAVHHAARAALMAGAGLVRLATSRASAAALQSSLPDVTVIETELGPGIEPELEEVLAWADAIVLGPGLGRSQDRRTFVAEVVAAADVPVIADADALQVGRSGLQAGTVARVLTPHHGEFRAVFPELVDGVTHVDPFAVARGACTLWNDEVGEDGPALTLLLKGVPTVIVSEDGRVRVGGAGNPGLATGGSGDLLSGFIGTFLAQGEDGGTAAALGAHLLGRAAEIAVAATGARSLRPHDVLESLPAVWRVVRLPTPAPPVLIEIESPVAS